jgi:hypothetical protein
LGAGLINPQWRPALYASPAVAPTPKIRSIWRFGFAGKKDSCRYPPRGGAGPPSSSPQFVPVQAAGFEPVVRFGLPWRPNPDAGTNPASSRSHLQSPKPIQARKVKRFRCCGTRTGRGASYFRCTGNRGASLAHAVGIERVGQKNAGAQQHTKSHDCFGHHLTPWFAMPGRAVFMKWR